LIFQPADVDTDVGKPWLDELYAELATFPHSKNADQVDVLA
jgi:phage terminase large subunit-like protein